MYGLDHNNTDKIHHESDGTTSYGSPNKIFAPFLFHSFDTLILMGNYCNINVRAAIHVNGMIACAN
jgi:hypothetical protein